MVSELHRVEVHDAVTGPGKRGQCESAETRQVMQACVWAEWRTVGVVVGVLNDEEHEQDKDGPSSTHHDDRGGRGQIGGPCSMCPRRVLGFVGLLSPHLRLISETSF